MTKWILRIAGVVALVLLATWIWHSLFPGPEQLIRKRLTQLAQSASSRSNEDPLAKAFRVESVTGYFTPDAEIIIDMPGEFSQTIHGINELIPLVTAARSMGRTIKVELVDITVTVAPDKTSAEAHMTGEAKISGESNVQVQELKAHFKKVQRDWLIDRVETVRTLH